MFFLLQANYNGGTDQTVSPPLFMVIAFFGLYSIGKNCLSCDTTFQLGKYGSCFWDFVSGRPDPSYVHILPDLPLNFFAGQKYGGVVFVAHTSAYFGGRQLRMLSGQIHAEMPCQGYCPVFLGWMYIGRRYAKVCSDGWFDIRYVNDRVCSGQMFGEDFFCQAQVDFIILQRRKSNELEQRPLQFPDICSGVFRDIFY